MSPRLLPERRTRKKGGNERETESARVLQGGAEVFLTAKVRTGRRIKVSIPGGKGLKTCGTRKDEVSDPERLRQIAKAGGAAAYPTSKIHLVQEREKSKLVSFVALSTEADNARRLRTVRCQQHSLRWEERERRNEYSP